MRVRMPGAPQPALRPLLDGTRTRSPPPAGDPSPDALKQSLFQGETLGGSKYFHWRDSFPPFCQISLL